MNIVKQIDKFKNALVVFIDNTEKKVDKLSEKISSIKADLNKAKRALEKLNEVLD